MTTHQLDPLPDTEQTFVRIVLDSVSPAGHCLTTFEVRMHRFVLAEFNTHRVFSRNSASSRAIPARKLIERVADDPAYPLKWAAEQPGMQGGDEIGLACQAVVRRYWDRARRAAIESAEVCDVQRLHKSLTNRLLEPFMWHTVIVTATSYQNFFGLRVSPAAQPEIQRIAALMEQLYRDSAPQVVERGDWHLPFLLDDEREMSIETAVKVSAARCARVSYLTHNGVRDFEQDVQLYNKLISAWPMHASPLEHVATPAPDNTHAVEVTSRFGGSVQTLVLPRYGNLIGWHQHRFDVESTRQYQAFS